MYIYICRCNRYIAFFPDLLCSFASGFTHVGIVALALALWLCAGSAWLCEALALLLIALMVALHVLLELSGLESALHLLLVCLLLVALLRLYLRLILLMRYVRSRARFECYSLAASVAL